MDNQENQTIKERLREFIMFKNISIREFERQIGVAYGFLSNMANSTSPKNFTKISRCYPELNLDWLLTGEGEMLRSESQVQNISGHHNATTMNGDIRQSGEAAAGNVSALFDSNKELISQHGELIRQHSELIRQQDELISIIRDLTGKLTVN